MGANRESVMGIDQRWHDWDGMEGWFVTCCSCELVLAPEDTGAWHSAWAREGEALAGVFDAGWSIERESSIWVVMCPKCGGNGSEGA